jgi:hypothetical protein
MRQDHLELERRQAELAPSGIPVTGTASTSPASVSLRRSTERQTALQTGA